jgi:DNA polymerase sigma
VPIAHLCWFSQIVDEERVLTARVPILKLKLKLLRWAKGNSKGNSKSIEGPSWLKGGSLQEALQAEVDVCVENRLGVCNTLMLRVYSKLDWRVTPLCLAVKAWTKRHGLANAFGGFLSSYAWTLLTIFYLQQRRPALLPSLQQRDLMNVANSAGSLPDQNSEWWDCRFCEDAKVAHAWLRAKTAAERGDAAAEVAEQVRDAKCAA